MAMEHIIELLVSDEKYAAKISLEDLEEVLIYAKDKYYNSDEPAMSDAEYDRLERIYTARSGEKMAVGAPVGKAGGGGVVLPYYMSSLDKIKYGQPSLNRWFSRHGDHFMLTGKMDGISALYINNHLYTRGEGNVGQDISLMLEILGLPELEEGVAVRGELIMNIDVFTRYFKGEARDKKYRCARNAVGGAVNSVARLPKADSSLLGDSLLSLIGNIDFVAYEMPSLTGKTTPSEQLENLMELGFKVVPNVKMSKKDLKGAVQEHLADTLSLFKKYPYEQDGLVIYADDVYPGTTEGLPEHIIAFKKDGDGYETVVESVEWNPSQYSKLVPVVVVEQVEIDGSRIKRVTAHNAKFIVDNLIGPGAIITIIRSGSVIPKITGVVVPVDMTEEELLPRIPYKWDKTHTNIYYDETAEKRATTASASSTNPVTHSSTAPKTAPKKRLTIKKAPPLEGTETATKGSALTASTTPSGSAPASTAPSGSTATTPTPKKITRLTIKASAKSTAKPLDKSSEITKENEQASEMDRKIKTLVSIKRFNNFVSKIGIKGLGEKRAELFVERNIDASMLLDMSESEVSDILGSDKIGSTVYAEIQSAIERLTIPTLIDACGLFDAGIGIKRATQVVIAFLKENEDFFSKDVEPEEFYYSRIIEMDGFAEKLSTLMASGLVSFIEYLQGSFSSEVTERILQNTIDRFTPAGIERHSKSILRSSRTPFPYAGKSVCITGFRDERINNFVVANGGSIQSACNGKTALLVTGGSKSSGKKVEEAEGRGIPIMTFGEFASRWL